ncbi:MAG: energy-coupling factor ABC transporter permease [Anaerosomatales bacterium]|nr:energy-coupling factor ABC transporter permease [Anaerosomatales bacterium]
MHMSDALMTPAVGGVMWGATAVATVYCAKKVREDLDESKIPLMGVAGAFVFAAQMLNFSIPGTGSSGHIGGGLLLAALLGPYAAFLVIASVLGVQALFFADGGLLALGANIFNLGFFPAFIAFPLAYRKIVGDAPTRSRIVTGSITAAVFGLLLGALGVVLQTTTSGIAELPFAAFAALMLPIHLAIGVVEGLVTAGVVLFVYQAQPEILARSANGRTLSGLRMRPVVVGLIVAALVSGGAFAWFASPDPDGLEWAIEGIAGTDEIKGASAGTHERAGALQERLSFLPNYGFHEGDAGAVAGGEGESGPLVDLGTTVAGIVGAVITLGAVALIGVVLRRRSASKTAGNS